MNSAFAFREKSSKGTGSKIVNLIIGLSPSVFNGLLTVAEAGRIYPAARQYLPTGSRFLYT